MTSRAGRPTSGTMICEVPEVMQAQWDLAARYGIDGFCYYYYWFDGHRLLDRPLNRLLELGCAGASVLSMLGK